MRSILRYGFTGAVYPVNPKAPAINGIRAYPSVLDIPDPVDLAVIVVKRDFVLPSMEQCAAKAVKGAIVVTAGFREIGRDGAELEEKITSVARRAGVVMMGPNCMGAFNSDSEVRLNATFARYDPPPGPIGLISQSGAMGAQVLDYANEWHLGFSKFLSIGNKSDLDENDWLEFLTEDEQTRVITLYLENFADAQRFRQVCSAATGSKPVVVLKAGRSAAGAKAATSHTGALAGSDTAVDALLASCGAIRADTVNDLLSISHYFSAPRRPKGNRVAMITNAGGPGIIATDELEAAGFELPELAPATLDKLRAGLPPEAICANPCDVLPGTGAKGYEVAVEAITGDPNIDSVLMLWTSPVMVKTKWVVDAVAPHIQASPVPVFGLFSGAKDLMEDGVPLEEIGMRLFSSAPFVIRGMVASRQYDQWLATEREGPRRIEADRQKAEAILARSGEGWMDADDAFGLLAAYGIPVARSLTIDPGEDPAGAASALSFPLVMKVVSEDILHKSDVGGVVVGIKDERELAPSRDRMLDQVRAKNPGARIDGIFLQEMAAGRTELIIGASREPGFGPLIMCGLGGVYVEVLEDVAFALAPLDGTEPGRMLERLRSAPILKGVRGKAGIDLGLLEDVICRVGAMAAELPRIEQLDINPLLAGPKGCVAVDARIRLLAQ